MISLVDQRLAAWHSLLNASYRIIFSSESGRITLKISASLVLFLNRYFSSFATFKVLYFTLRVIRDTEVRSIPEGARGRFRNLSIGCVAGNMRFWGYSRGCDTQLVFGLLIVPEIPSLLLTTY